jgi:Holliday junction resolvase-like predicted endonuclease
MSNQSIGKNGEEIAKSHLEKMGYKILETNIF